MPELMDVVGSVGAAGVTDVVGAAGVTDDVGAVGVGQGCPQLSE